MNDRNRPPRLRRLPVAASDGLLGFVLAALVALVGVSTAVVWFATGLLDQTQAPTAFARAGVPGSVSVELTQVGSHVIYLEGADPAGVPAAQLDVTGVDGAAVPVRPYSLDLRYDVPGRPGVLGTAIAVFDADRTGSYTVETDAVVADVVVADRGAQLAVGDDLAPATVRAVVLPALVALVSVLAACALAVRTWIRRRRRSQS